MLYRHLTQRRLFRSQEDQLFAQRRLINGRNRAHDHDFYEIVVVFKGTGFHRTIHGQRRLSRGDAFILKPGYWHAYEMCRQLGYVDCCFGTKLLHRELAWTLEDPILSFTLWNGPEALNTRGMLTLKLAPKCLEKCGQHLEKIRQKNEDFTISGRLERIGLLIQLLGCLTQDLKSSGNRDASGESGQHIAATRTVELFEMELGYPWTLSKLARQLNLHPSYLVRLFKAAMQDSPMAYLKKRRMETAANMLLRTTNPVADIAFTVGIEDPAYFARCFRQHFGLSATDYRHMYLVDHS